MNFSELTTPALLLEKEKLMANIKRMQANADRLGVKLRPHLKTMKAAKAAEALIASGACGITVSTLKEASYFLQHGFKDMTYAVGIVATKLPEVASLMAAGADLKIMTDNLEMAGAITANANQSGTKFKVLIEIDSGDNRGGLQPDSAELLEIAGLISNSSAHFQGVLTHGGHSYGVNTVAEIEQIAEQERQAVVLAATRLRAEGIAVETVSVGSTPTALNAKDLTGVTELRAGVYTVFDMDQQSLGVCHTDDIAMSVLCCVIGHNKAAGKILLDAGGLALSKDRSADKFRPELGYGQICQADGSVIPELYVTSVSQEHGHVKVRDDNDYLLFPVGAQLRILPIHACMTAAAYDCFHVIEGGVLTDTWGRVNGW
ncbi:MAG: D-serine deaminase-like pyridoxal phosphate-dependent protein [Gammaproteobacteria bacterium]|jgi:D-serine deaminase-like pyridoxal phosphate-dependent protein